MKLIVNADDFGMSKGVNLGILEAINEGVVTSTSMMTNMPGFDHAIELMKENEGLDVGIHFVLTTGKPLVDTNRVSSLINDKGSFEHNIERLAVANKEELRLELHAQMEKFLKTGFSPSHIDFHHEVNFAGNALDVAIEVAKEYNLPMRGFEANAIAKMKEAGVKHTDRFLYGFYGDELTIDTLLDEIRKGDEVEVVEVMCHPAYVDSFLMENSSYNTQRANELDILTSEGIKKYMENNEIELMGFREL